MEIYQLAFLKKLDVKVGFGNIFNICFCFFTKHFVEIIMKKKGELLE
jgi:hypothetical protein